MRARRGLTLVEAAVATAVGVTLYLALDAQLDQQRRMLHLVEGKVAARQVAAVEARRLLVLPHAREQLERDGLDGYRVRCEELGPAGLAGAVLWRVSVERPGQPGDAVEVVVRG